MNKLEKQVVDEVLKTLYTSTQNLELVNGFKIRLLEASQSTTNQVVVTDYNLNIIKIYKSVSHYLIDKGLECNLKNKNSLHDKLRDNRAFTEDTLIHYKRNFDKGIYSLPKKLKILFNFQTYDDTSSICTKYGVIVDNDDVSKLKGYSPTIDSDKSGRKYCVIKKDNKNIRLHRFLTNCPKDRVVDHINGNYLDNRKCNLRICMQYHNTLNRGLTKPTKYQKTSKYMGVSARKNTYRVSTSILKQRIDKTLKTELAAVRLYDVVNLALAGEYANINLDKSNYSKELVDRFYRLYLKNFKRVSDL